MTPTQQVLAPSQTRLPISGNCVGHKHEIEDGLRSAILDHRQVLESSFDSLFGRDQEESKVQKARAILGSSVDGVQDDELSTYLTQFQYLLDEWLDIYEKQIFNGLTLQQVLQEG